MQSPPKELMLGQEPFDSQHAELLAALSEVSAVMRAGGDPTSIDPVLNRFADALLSHVAAEEAIMEEVRYPELARHRVAHELFVADFLQMRSELADRGVTPSIEGWIRTRIPEWLRFHILANDRPLAEYLARRPAPPPPGPARAARRRS